ncbi:MAG TPA: 4a-hydroxytetrahydrobiopterin dehydratase [Candidatus Saccharimonadales bacterium]|nr:4a-hydroxytetrahydrobiopterin dehydratase [Candidatus Saccharimonadales bacterium]
MSKLSFEEAEKHLDKLPKWELVDETIHRNYEFKSFEDAIKFIDALAKFASKLNHHPDLTNSYNKVSVSLTTHSASGLTLKDFELAKIAEKTAEKFS